MGSDAQVRPQLLVATTNRAKIREITQLLSAIPYDIVTLSSWRWVAPPEETGRTFIENARAKARYYAAATGQLTTADDSGLEIDALGGAPGIESARFGGPGSYAQKFRLIYEALRANGAIGAPARFVCAVALVNEDRILFETTGIVEGRIAPEPRGSGGFGYDPIFFYPPFQRTLAEVSAEEKASISHRGQAFRALRQFLEAEQVSHLRDRHPMHEQNR